MKKKPLLIVGGIAVILIVAILALPLFVNVNKFKPTLETDISTALGRQVTIGNISLAIFSGGVTIDDVAIADDPAFSHSSFLTAKQVTAGVALMPLIFSQKLEVGSFTVTEPVVTLLRSAPGAWNFSSFGASGSKANQGSSGATNFEVAKLKISNGTLLIGSAGKADKAQKYEGVNLEVSDLSYTSQFPFTFTTKIPGGGTVKIDGKAGPIDSTDAALTPLDAKIEADNVDIAATGFVDPSSGVAGTVDFSGDLGSDGKQMISKGTVKGTKLKLAAAGSPSTVPLDVDYATNYDLKRGTGNLTQGDVHIGKALAHLTGLYDTSKTQTTVQMKLTGEAMPVPDLEGMMPAVGVKLPSGASLQTGSLNLNLAISGPVNGLTIAGPVNLSNAKLAGFDLKSKLGALASFAGIKGNDSGTEIQTLSTNLHVDPSGTHAQNLNVVIPSIGTITGDGNVSSDGKLDCKMNAVMASGSALGAVASGVSFLGNAGKSGKGIPFKVEGTTSNPVFIPDVAGLATGFAKGSVSDVGSVGGAAKGALGGLFGKKKN
jgi:AsmA protein